jgi:hypothetical protein
MALVIQPGMGVNMKNMLKKLLICAGFTLLATGAVHAKDEVKKAPAPAALLPQVQN